MEIPLVKNLMKWIMMNLDMFLQMKLIILIQFVLLQNLIQID